MKREKERRSNILVVGILKGEKQIKGMEQMLHSINQKMKQKTT